MVFRPSDVSYDDATNVNARMLYTATLLAVKVSSDSHQLIYPSAAVGIDYFGPLYVHAGPLTRSVRKNPKLYKHYGCIFTSLRYRATHIDLARSLTRDSFINAVTRFFATRGLPRVLYSDNGTNFRGAETDVVNALKRRDRERVGRELLREIFSGTLIPLQQVTKAVFKSGSFALFEGFSML